MIRSRTARTGREGPRSPRSRCRSPIRPAAPIVRATEQSQSNDAADTVPPGSLGIWVNGEMSIIQAGHCSGRPNTPMTPTRATAVHASAMDSQGSSPNSKTASAATTIVAGSRASAAPNSLGTWVLTDPVRTPLQPPRQAEWTMQETGGGRPSQSVWQQSRAMVTPGGEQERRRHQDGGCRQRQAEHPPALTGETERAGEFHPPERRSPRQPRPPGRSGIADRAQYEGGAERGDRDAAGAPRGDRQLGGDGGHAAEHQPAPADGQR